MTFVGLKIFIRIGYLLIFMFCFNVIGHAQNSDSKTDRELVYAAVEDYVLALYEVSPERIVRSVDTELRKVGYYDYNGEAYYNVPMTYEQLYELAGSWNADGNQVDNESPKLIEIYQVHNKTASAKLTAQWGIDFMHLYKKDGKWKIMNIMWQSEPEK